MYEIKSVLTQCVIESSSLDVIFFILISLFFCLGVHGQELIDVVSPTSCQLAFDGKRLWRCHLPQAAFAAHGLKDTAVPVHTKLLFRVQGNCSTPFPLSLSVGVNDTPSVNGVSMFSPAPVFVRGEGLGLITKLALSDAFPNWTSMAVFDSSCRITLEISYNEINCTSVVEAHELLTAIDSEIQGAVASRDLIRDWLEFQSVFDLLNFLILHAYDRLAEPAMQSLRELRRKLPDGVFATMITRPGISENSQAVMALLQLQEVLNRLATSEAWEEKTLSELLGLSNIQLLTELSTKTVSKDDRERQLAQVVEKIERLKRKRVLAELQLASVLSGEKQ